MPEYNAICSLLLVAMSNISGKLRATYWARTNILSSFSKNFGKLSAFFTFLYKYSYRYIIAAEWSKQWKSILICTDEMKFQISVLEVSVG